MNTAETHRLIENTVRIGTIAAIDYAQRKLKVQSGELLTEWLSWPAEIGRNYRRWRPLRLHTQVVLASVAGDPAQAEIIGMLYSDAVPCPSNDPDIDLIAFDNGSFIEHNHNAKTMKLHCAGDLAITAAGNIKIEAKRVDIN